MQVITESVQWNDGSFTLIKPADLVLNEDNVADVESLLETEVTLGTYGVTPGGIGEPNDILYVIMGRYIEKDHRNDRFAFVFKEVPEEAGDDVRNYFVNIWRDGDPEGVDFYSFLVAMGVKGFYMFESIAHVAGDHAIRKPSTDLH